MTYKIAVVGGDGTGPEVVAEGLKCLEAIAAKFSLDFQFDKLGFGAKRYLETGQVLSDDEIELLKSYDAIYLGAIGDPAVTPGVLERGILLKLRFDLDQYINYRPVKLYESVYTPIKNKTHEHIDYLVVRENTGGLYVGAGHIQDKGSSEEVATQEMIYSRLQVERCLRFAFESVRKRHQSSPWKGLSDDDRANGYIGQLTLCGKTNVLNYVFDLWQRVFDELALEYSDVKCDYTHVDAVCIYMVECPERFDVIVTSNMFGDIITDLAAVTQGGMGVAASANINPDGVSMFEPIGGTAPAFTGLNQINPMAAIGAAHIMLDHLGEHDAALVLEEAKKSVILKMDSMQAAKMGFSTTEIGDMVVEQLHRA